jgi:probable rRNA maturation factor
MRTRSRRAKSRPRPSAAVAVQLACRARGAPSPGRLRAFARAAAGAGAALTLRIVAEREARRLNRAYRGRRYAPNVLSFPYRRAPLCGDIVLCHPVIAREARARGKALLAHYAHLVVHGVLHLRGRDHASARAASRMEREEAGILRRLGFGDPYAVE